jgi:hypothetical protein
LRLLGSFAMVRLSLAPGVKRTGRDTAAWLQPAIAYQTHSIQQRQHQQNQPRMRLTASASISSFPSDHPDPSRPPTGHPADL